MKRKVDKIDKSRKQEWTGTNNGAFTQHSILSIKYYLFLEHRNLYGLLNMLKMRKLRFRENRISEKLSDLLRGHTISK